MRLTRATLLFFWLMAPACLMVHAQPGQTLACPDMPGLAPLLQPGRVLLLGEMHGTHESPAFLAQAACTALRQGRNVTVGLELPHAETPYLDAFLGSQGDAAAIRRFLQAPFWQRAYQDGRTSRAMLHLIRQLRAYRAAGHPLRVLLIDEPAARARRDSVMSAHLHAAAIAAPSDVVLVLTGNIHNRMSRGVRWDADYEPMGYRLGRAIDAAQIVSLNVAYAGGDAWVCFSGEASECGPKPLQGRADTGDGVTLFETDTEAYHGTYAVGRISASPPAANAPPTVAITIDDLPYVGGPRRLDDVAYTAEQFVAALARYDAPASGFVTGSNVLIDGQVDARLDVLRRWRDGGIRLENHSFSHVSFHELPLTDYLDDAAQGQLFPERLMRERSDSVRFYRHPFNHTGTSETAKQAFAGFLEARALQLAPFTVEHADYLFNRLYAEARERADAAMMARIGEAYLAQLDTAFAFAERLADDTFGHAIPHIFLIHSNILNADYLERMLARLQARGYRFITLDEAVRDPAYTTPDPFTGNYGISWLHRWRMSLGLEKRLRDEPDPPRWILDAYQQLQR